MGEQGEGTGHRTSKCQGHYGEGPEGEQKCDFAERGIEERNRSLPGERGCRGKKNIRSLGWNGRPAS